jgi:hypothetical protein
MIHLQVQSPLMKSRLSISNNRIYLSLSEWIKSWPGSEKRSIRSWPSHRVTVEYASASSGKVVTRSSSISQPFMPFNRRQIKIDFKFIMNGENQTSLFHYFRQKSVSNIPLGIGKSCLLWWIIIVDCGLNRPWAGMSHFNPGSRAPSFAQHPL